MKIIQSFKKYGYEFNLSKSEEISVKGNGRKRYKAIYVGTFKGAIKPNIEVVILEESNPIEMWQETEKQIRYPGSEDWGKKGWTYNLIELAELKYDEIT